MKLASEIGRSENASAVRAMVSESLTHLLAPYRDNRVDLKEVVSILERSAVVARHRITDTAIRIRKSLHPGYGWGTTADQLGVRGHRVILLRPSSYWAILKLARRADPGVACDL